MKIAVPTNDGVTLSEHFGRSNAFLIFELENGQITSRSKRSNRACHAGTDHDHHHGPSEGHSHEGILGALSGYGPPAGRGAPGHRHLGDPRGLCRTGGRAGRSVCRRLTGHLRRYLLPLQPLVLKEWLPGES